MIDGSRSKSCNNTPIFIYAGDKTAMSRGGRMNGYGWRKGSRYSRRLSCSRWVVLISTFFCFRLIIDLHESQMDNMFLDSTSWPD